MAVQSEAVAERHLPNFLLRAAVGDDGDTRAELCGATPFRILDIGWLVGVDGGCPSGALRSDIFPNFRHRVVGGG